jgi:uncharacterized membrane-anchored protein YjiN (DUF445 family)
MAPPGYKLVGKPPCLFQEGNRSIHPTKVATFACVWERLEALLRRHYDLETAFVLDLPSPPPARPPLRRRYRIMAQLLKYAPYVLTILIGFYLLYRWIPFLPKAYESWYERIYILSVTGMIGYVTNWLAIKMLFRPRHPRPIWGQGLVPANKLRIAEQFASAISKHILNEETLYRVLHEAGVAQRLAHAILQGTSGLLNDSEFQQTVRSTIKALLIQYVRDPYHQKQLIRVIDAKLLQVVPAGIAGGLFRSYRQLNEKGYYEVLQRTVLSIPDAVEEALKNLNIPEEEIRRFVLSHTEQLETLLTEIIRSVVSRLQLYNIIYAQISAFDETQLENLFLTTTNEHLQFIQNLGAVLGVLSGVFIMNPLLAAVGATVTIGALWVIDEVWYRLRRERRVE